MNQFTKEQINDLADKLLIGLNEEENKIILEEFNELENNINSILQIKELQKIKPMTHPFELEEVLLREDETIEELDREDVLKNAEEKNLTSIIIPKVVANE